MKKWKLRTQLIVGFAAVLVFTLILGIVSIFSLKTISEVNEANQKINKGLTRLYAVTEQVALYNNYSHSAGRDIQAEIKKKILEGFGVLIGDIENETVTAVENQLPIADQLKGLLGNYNKYRDLFSQYASSEEKLPPIAEEINQSFDGYDEVITAAFIKFEEMLVSQKLLHAGYNAYFGRQTQEKREENEALAGKVQ